MPLLLGDFHLECLDRFTAEGHLQLGQLRPSESRVSVDLQQVFAVRPKRITDVDAALAIQSPEVVVLNANRPVIAARSPALGTDGILGRIRRDVSSYRLSRDLLGSTKVFFHQDRRHR